MVKHPRTPSVCLAGSFWCGGQEQKSRHAEIRESTRHTLKTPLILTENFLATTYLSPAKLYRPLLAALLPQAATQQRIPNWLKTRRTESGRGGGRNGTQGKILLQCLKGESMHYGLGLASHICREHT